MIASFAAVGVAHSADLAVPPLAPVQDFSGWYLRGDIGFSNQQVGSLFNANYSRFSSVDNIDKGFDAAPLFGLGVGYNINNWLRVDVTGEYRARANFHGLDIGHTPGQDWPDRYTGSKYEWTFLLNGYVDLGTWWNFTPFLGAGVGFSRNTITNFGDINVSTLVGADAHSMPTPARRISRGRSMPAWATGHEQHDPRTLISIYRPWRRYHRHHVRVHRRCRHSL